MHHVLGASSAISFLVGASDDASVDASGPSDRSVVASNSPRDPWESSSEKTNVYRRHQRVVHAMHHLILESDNKLDMCAELPTLCNKN